MQFGLYLARVMEGYANHTSTADLYNGAKVTSAMR